MCVCFGVGGEGGGGGDFLCVYVSPSFSLFLSHSVSLKRATPAFTTVPKP